MKSVELTIKLRNNLLKERRLILGLTTVKMAEACGVAYALYIEYENMRASPVGRSRHRVLRWRPSAQKIADYHGCLPEELWPQALLAIKQPEVVTKINADEIAMVAKLAASAEPSLLPELALDQGKLATAVAASLGGLTKRERNVLRRRFGLDGEEPETLATIGARMGVKQERVRQIEARALRKLRHPVKVRVLAEFSEDEATVEWYARLAREEAARTERRLRKLAGLENP